MKNLLQFILPGSFLLILYGFFLTQLPRDVFWNGDNGMKVIQAQSVIANHFRSLKLIYPAEMNDPEFNHAPFDRDFCVRVNNSFYGQYSPVFTVPLAVSLLIFKSWGGTVFLFAGVAGCICLLWRLSVFQQRPCGFLLFCILGCPFFWYSFSQYEVIWVCLCLILFFYIGLKPQVSRISHLIAGLSLGIQACIRLEGYLFLVVLGLIYIFHIISGKRQVRPLVWFVVGMALPIIPLWCVNFSICAHILGPMFLANHYTAEIAGMSYFTLVLIRMDIILLNLLPILGETSAGGIYALLTISLLFSLRNKKYLLVWLVITILLAVIWNLFLVSSGYMNRTFFLMAPFSIGFLLPLLSKTTTTRNWALGVLALFVALVLKIPIETPFDWGCRYLVPLYFIIFFLIFKELENFPFGLTLNIQHLKKVLAVVLLFSFVVQCLGVKRLMVRKIVYEERANYLQNLDEDFILSDDKFAVQLYARLYQDKKFMHLASMENMAQMDPAQYHEVFLTGVEQIVSMGQDKFVFITGLSLFSAPSVNVGKKFDMELPSGKKVTLAVVEEVPVRNNIQFVRFAIHSSKA